MKRSSSPPPCALASPKATLRAPVRVFCTGMAWSRSITSVTSLMNGCTCVTWPEHAVLVDHRRAGRDAVGQALVDDHLAGVGVGGVVEHLGRAAGRGDASRAARAACAAARSPAPAARPGWRARTAAPAPCARVRLVALRASAGLRSSRPPPSAQLHRLAAPATGPGRAPCRCAARIGCTMWKRASATIRNSASALKKISLESADGPWLKRGGAVRSRVPSGMV